MTSILRQFYRLTRLCVAGEGGRIGALYFVIIFALGLVGVQITVRLIAWTADFYNALQNLDVDEALRQIAIFFGLIACSATLYLAGAYLRKLLIIRWRRTLTEAALSAWLARKAYWHLRDRADHGVDNPDQRIADDCRIYVDKLTGEAIELMTNIVALFTYVSILWSLSTFPLAFSIGGMALEIPRYMVWAAPLYVAIATGATHFLGKPLKALNFEQQRREADFRFALTRLRENVEAVALSDGEDAERRTLSARFRAALDNWRQVARRELILGCFTRPYMQTVLRIPLFLALPAFLAGRITFGGLMQISSAFQNVVTTLSWFIFSYRDLAELAAAAGRLTLFLDAAEAAARSKMQPVLAVAQNDRLVIDAVRLKTPAGRALAPTGRLEFEPGGTYWISAPSGHGKSTLVKAIAGLWPHDEGSIARPGAPMVFMPQHAYLPLGSLTQALTYPGDPLGFDETSCRHALAAVGLEPLWGASDTAWEEARRGLSGGERQRLALARLILQRPAWAILDEATSALDADSEAAVLSALRETLPHTTLLIIAHRRPRIAGPLRELSLEETAASLRGAAPARQGDASFKAAIAS